MISLYKYQNGRHLGQGPVVVPVPPVTNPPIVVTSAPAPSYSVNPVFWVAGGIFAVGLIAYIMKSSKK